MPPAADSPPTVLVAGCGDLGTEVALRLAQGGQSVLGLRRRAHLLPEQLHGLSADLTRDRPELPEGSYDRLAVVLTADGSDAEAYRETYVGGLSRTLDALGARGVTPTRAVLVSSTGVYGDATGPLDETSATSPTRPTHEALLEAERLFHDRLPHGTVLRLSGLYGPGRSAFITRAREGRVRDRWTNRIHRDDAAAAIVHLLTRVDDPDTLYLGTDTEPAPARDVAELIRRLSGLPPPPPPDTPTDSTALTPPGRLLSCERLVSSGFAFTYPTYREGYAAILAGRGERHP